MTLAVVGAGFGRTGTLSLKAALETLGFAPCHHMVEVARQPADALLWTTAARSAAPDWPALVRGYAAAVDWPAAAFWRELASAFPTARVILTVRDSAAWYASFRETILARTRSLAPPRDSPLRAIYDLTQELIFDGVFAGQAADEAHAIAVYEAHNRRVVDCIARERLLVYDLTDGWAPLCRFLQRPIPSEPFPHLNTRAGFLREYLGSRARSARRNATRS
jgi:hypothetical protein